MRFLDSKSPFLGEEADSGLEHVNIDLGNVRDNATRWWMAVLAPKEGWRATIHRKGQTYYSPWSVHADVSKIFVLQSCPTNLHNIDTKPPSSSDTLQFLSDFCSVYE